MIIEHNNNVFSLNIIKVQMREAQKLRNSSLIEQLLLNDYQIKSQLITFKVFKKTTLLGKRH